MTTESQFWWNIIAIALSPAIAVQVSEFLARVREKRSRRRQIFESLMVTRADRLSPEHVRALNSVDLAFDGRGRKDAAVRAAWREYFDHLDSLKGALATDVWTARGDELRVTLLQRMATSLGHRVEATDLRRAIYRPMGHNQLEADQLRIRQWILALAEGNAAIPITPKLGDTPLSPELPPQK